MLPKDTLKDKVAIITGATLVIDGGQWLGHGHYLGALERVTSPGGRS